MKYLIIGLSLVLLSACGGNDDSNQNAQSQSVSAPADVSQVVGIGKVEPQDGVVDLASDAGGIVDSIGKQAGDTLKKGDIIVKLRQQTASLKVQQLKDQIVTQRSAYMEGFLGWVGVGCPQYEPRTKIYRHSPFSINHNLHPQPNPEGVT